MTIEPKLCRYCGTPEEPETPHYPQLCISRLQDRVEVLELVAVNIEQIRLMAADLVERYDKVVAERRQLREVLQQTRIYVDQRTIPVGPTPDPYIWKHKMLLDDIDALLEQVCQEKEIAL